MRKTKLLIFVFTFLLAFGLMATAASAKTVTVTKDGGEFIVDIDGAVLQSDVPPMVENGTTLVPMRVIFETLNATVNYNSTDKTINAVRNDVKIDLKLNDEKAYVNGELKVLAVPAKAVNGRTLVPLRFVGEALGEKVNYVVKSANDPNNTTASSYKETYYSIAENMADATGLDNNAITALKTAYTYADYYKTYGDIEFLNGAKNKYATVANCAVQSLQLTEKAIGNCGGFTEYAQLKHTLKDIASKYEFIKSLSVGYSEANLNKMIDCYSEISQLWNIAMNQWTAVKPE